LFSLSRVRLIFLGTAAFKTSAEENLFLTSMENKITVDRKNTLCSDEIEEK